MYSFYVNGGKKINGEVQISPAKNSVLTIMCASILLKGEVIINNCPKIGDVLVMGEILTKIGAKLKWISKGLYINTQEVYLTQLPENKTSKIRASLFLIGPLLSRFGTCTITKPGGCNIGTRPIDIHINGFESLGAKCLKGETKLTFTATQLKGGKVHLKYPSVGATENLIMGAVLSNGVTLLENCAKEPEVKDLCDFLNQCGCKITGGGTSYIRIEGVKKLSRYIEYTPIDDRIEAGTFLLATYLVGGRMTLSYKNAENIYFIIKKICDNTCKNSTNYVNIYSDKIYIVSDGNPKGFGRIVTAPYPLFPTDLHPQISAVGAQAKGETTVVETVFDSRFSYLKGLKTLGADFTTTSCSVTFKGKPLHGGIVEATDLRGGVALLLAGLKIDGMTEVYNSENILRGYENLDKKLIGLGLDVKLKKTEIKP